MTSKEIRDLIHNFLEMNIQKVAPCHCTGDLAIALFKSAYGKDFIQAGVGRSIDFEERFSKRRVVYGEKS